MTFPEYVAELKRNKVRQYQIAKELKITPGHLTNILKGKRKIDTNLAQFIEDWSDHKVSFAECLRTTATFTMKELPKSAGDESFGTPYKSDESCAQSLREAGYETDSGKGSAL